ncbi:MAG: glycerophosphoryl diester phosphodiesterase membrane domain-containing protein [Sphaerochaetaceae bacterium]|nr:glycerophosphoryl diester phosphodiesterase membrane domain-containing protein [Sphaerochaetaceae bacterium]
MESNQNEELKVKQISFRKLSYEALPEMWTFQFLVGLLLIIPAALMSAVIGWVAGLGGEIITTANIKSFILSWKLPVVLILGFIMVVIYLVFELLAQIYMNERVLNGKQVSIRQCLMDAIKSVKRFMNPAGVKAILFIFIAAPLCGVGFVLSLSQSFYIPNFIMEVVLKTPLFTAFYLLALVVLILIAFKSMFIFHTVIMDGMTPAEGRKYSAKLVKENKWKFLKGLVVNTLAIAGIIIASNVILYLLPKLILGGWGDSLPKNYKIDLAHIFATNGSLTSLELELIAYRTCASFAVLIEKYLFSIVSLLCGAYFMLRISKYYLEFSGRGRELWPERPKKSLYRKKIIMIILMFAVFIVASIFIGLQYNAIITRDKPVTLVAHRTGGTMASENSLEGLELAIEHGCYAAETDIQRTKDGYYIINHDNDFGRLTGVYKAPQDMTLAEIRELRIKDTTGNGQELKVPEFEEMLDVAKGRIKLFVELKGATADRQMVDDAVRIIREHDCVNDVALISLDYDIINYAETTYPEFETGTLFFASLGNVAKLNCDLIIMEEESATDTNISNIHEAGKEAIVWTVNTEDGLYHFLDSKVDSIITDEIILAEKVQKQLNERTDLEVLEDNLEIF